MGAPGGRIMNGVFRDISFGRLKRFLTNTSTRAIANPPAYCHLLEPGLGLQTRTKGHGYGLEFRVGSVL